LERKQNSQNDLYFLKWKDIIPVSLHHSPTYSVLWLFGSKRLSQLYHTVTSQAILCIWQRLFFWVYSSMTMSVLKRNLFGIHKLVFGKTRTWLLKTRTPNRKKQIRNNDSMYILYWIHLILYRDEDIKIPWFIMLINIVNPLQKTLPFSYTESLFRIWVFLFRVRLFKSQVRVFSKTSPDFFRVRILVFLESESGFRSMPFYLVDFQLKRIFFPSRSPQKTLLSENVRKCDDISWFRF
jgi:hypothetical protein